MGQPQIRAARDSKRSVPIVSQQAHAPSLLELTLFRGDCIERMKTMEAASVDLILTDLPFGITDLPWDTLVPLGPLWEQFQRLLKPNGAAILFAMQPFATDVINAARKLFRYEVIWDKRVTTGFLNAHKMPMRQHENLLVFYRHLPYYRPPGLWRAHDTKRGGTGHRHLSRRLEA